MKPQDFENVKHFTYEECAKTGADMAGVKKKLIYTMDDLRLDVGCRFTISSNGLNSGKHAPNGDHYKGLGIDGRFRNCPWKPNVVLQKALDAGFNAIGFYYEGFWHFGIREKHKMWYRDKHGVYWPMLMWPYVGAENNAFINSFIKGEDNENR